jgi:hypothetical protein
MSTEVFSVDNALLSESRKIIKQFGGELKGELLSSLEEGGPLNAISVCSRKAPEIAERMAQEKGWEIARTSLKYRNPDNAPDNWEQRALESFEERNAKGEAVETMEYYEVLDVDGKKVFRYMKAIPVGEPCLTCHGKKIPHDLNAKLKELYPEDQSVGFSVGKIIGAFSIRMSI